MMEETLKTSLHKQEKDLLTVAGLCLTNFKSLQRSILSLKFRVYQMPFPFFMNANQDSLNISYLQFRENKCVMAFSFEKMQDVNFTGT